MTSTTVNTTFAGDIRWGLAQDMPAPRRCGTRVVAVASSGGKHVDQAFEDVREFFLYETSATTTTFIGRQPCPLSQSGRTAEAAARLLRDCDLVLCAGIGAPCRQLLDGLGVRCCLEYTGEPMEHAVARAGRCN